MPGSYWRCVPCGADVEFGTAHRCPVDKTGAIESPRERRRPRSLPRTPWPPVTYRAQEIPSGE